MVAREDQIKRLLLSQNQEMNSFIGAKLTDQTILWGQERTKLKGFLVSQNYEMI